MSYSSPFGVPALFVRVSALPGSCARHVPPGAPGEHLFPPLSVHCWLCSADPKRHKLKPSECHSAGSIRPRNGSQSQHRWDRVQQEGDQFSRSILPYSPGPRPLNPGVQRFSGGCDGHGGFSEAAERRSGGYVCGGPAGRTGGGTSAAARGWGSRGPWLFGEGWDVWDSAAEFVQTHCRGSVEAANHHQQSEQWKRWVEQAECESFASWLFLFQAQTLNILLSGLESPLQVSGMSSSITSLRRSKSSSLRRRKRPGRQTSVEKHNGEVSASTSGKTNTTFLCLQNALKQICSGLFVFCSSCVMYDKP